MGLEERDELVIGFESVIVPSKVEFCLTIGPKERSFFVSRRICWGLLPFVRCLGPLMLCSRGGKKFVPLLH